MVHVLDILTFYVNNFRSKYKKNIPDMMFATADSSKLIKNGEASKYDQNNQIIENNMNTSIIESVFGKKLHEEYNH